MNGEVFDFRAFQTVRDNVVATGLSPIPLFDQLRRAQRAGDRGNAVIAAAQRLRRQFQDDVSSVAE